MKEFLRIGLSACFFHPDPGRAVFGPKTLLYFEESMARLVISYGAFPILLPRKAHGIGLEDILAQVDALILQAGSDIAPDSYKEEALQADWAGDKIRDDYEIELIREAMRRDKPVLGICRGLQLINVAFGGSLYQDIPTQVKTQVAHRNPELYDSLTHELKLEPETRMFELYRNIPQRKVISVHHQAIKDLGADLLIEARSKEDGLIEAIRYNKANSKVRSPYIFGVQWHPEYQDPADASLMSPGPILQELLKEAAARKV